jgi:hypothetical protein
MPPRQGERKLTPGPPALTGYAASLPPLWQGIGAQEAEQVRGWDNQPSAVTPPTQRLRYRTPWPAVSGWRDCLLPRSPWSIPGISVAMSAESGRAALLPAAMLVATGAPRVKIGAALPPLLTAGRSPAGPSASVVDGAGRCCLDGRCRWPPRQEPPGLRCHWRTAERTLDARRCAPEGSHAGAAERTGRLDRCHRGPVALLPVSMVRRPVMPGRCGFRLCLRNLPAHHYGMTLERP